MANESDRSWDTPPNVEGSIACVADWDPACLTHQGQQSFKRLHKQAEDNTASDQRQAIISFLAMREPSRQVIRIWEVVCSNDSNSRAFSVNRNLTLDSVKP